MKQFLNSLGIVALSCLLASCVHLKVTAGVLGDDVNVADVQAAIDSKLATFFKQRAPDLKIEPSKCPSHIDVSRGRVAWCSLTVNGVKIPVRVVYFGPPQNFKVNFDGSFFERRWIENNIEKTLKASYDVTTQVHCPLPTVELLKAGTFFTCSVSGSPRVTSVRMKALENGNIFQYKVPGLVSLDEAPDDSLSKHKAGKPVILNGSDVEAYLTHDYLPIAAPNPQDLSVTCPAVVDLTGPKRAVCLVHLKDKNLAQRLSIWIVEPNGFTERPIDAVLDRQRVQQWAQNDINSKLQENNLPTDAVVDCGKGLVVVPVGGTFDCHSTAGGKSYRLIITAHDFRGTVSWHGVEAPTASPAASMTPR